ncbi:MAG: PilZ domain-containing protein [Pseudomonadales bacterium]
MEQDIDSANRRKHPRHNLRDVVRVVDKATGQSIGSVANLSLEGLMLVNNAPLHVDCIYQLSVCVDGSVLGEADNKTVELHLGVDCLWNSPASSVTAAAYWSGCQIIDVADEDLVVIQHLIDALALD